MNLTGNSIIPIFYACDSRFLKYTTVSIASLIANASPDYTYHIHILHNDISPDEEKNVLRMQTDKVRIIFDDVSEHLEAVSELLPIRDYYTKTTYYRLFIAEMFPELDKAIYIDSDTVVVGDISGLFLTDIGDNYVGACHEQAMVQVKEYGEYVEKCLGINRNNYFNAGVLLLNCRQFREKQVLRRFYELLNFYDFVVTQDEDYLNIICQGHVKFLHQGWNVETFGKIPCEEKDFRIIHYIMTSKPWHFRDCVYSDVFWSYAEKVAAYNEICEVLESYTDRQRKEDAILCDRLMQTAIAETRREDNYLNRLKKHNCNDDRRKILEKIERYESEGRFDEDVEDDPPGRTIMPGEVDYTQKKLKTRLSAKLSYIVAKRYLNSIVRKRQLIVKEIRGSENLAALKTGAVITCNHFNAMDSFAMQLAFMSANQKDKKMFRVIREGNYTSFPGFFGFLMRHFYTLPLSSNLQTQMEFIRAVDTLLQDGNFVLVYPEQSMWWNYRKPKPLKEGAFYFAAKNRLPVVPCFITMEDSEIAGDDGFPIQEYTIHIGKPIMPDPDKSARLNTKAMMAENYELWKDIYESEYNIPLTYTTEVN